MKFQSLILLCFTLLVFNCSKSDDSDGEPSRPEGEIVLYFDTDNSENTILFSSLNNTFDIPCDFGEFAISYPVDIGNRSFEFLDINIPYEAIINGDNFSLTDTFSDGLGNDLTSSVSIRVDGNNYVALAGDFANLAFSQSETEEGVLLFSFSAELTMELVGIPSRGTNVSNLHIRIEVREVGKSDITTC